MFWKKKKNKFTEQQLFQFEVFSNFSTLQITTLYYLNLTKRYDTFENKHQKVLTYLYFDILAGAYVGGEETQDQVDLICLMRDFALKGLDERGYPQYRTFHADNLDDMSNLKEDHSDVISMLDTNRDFASSAINKIKQNSNEFLDGIKTRKMDSISSQLSDLVNDDLLKSKFEQVNFSSELSRKSKVDPSDSSNKKEKKPGPWDFTKKGENASSTDNQTNALDQIINQQIKNVKNKFKGLGKDKTIRSEYIIIKYCTLLTAAFSGKNDTEYLTVQGRAYARRLLGKNPITYEEFNDYMNKNPLFSTLSSHIISTEIKKLISFGLSALETKEHLDKILDQLINAKTDELRITCQYCAVSDFINNINVTNDSKLYCSDDYETDENTGLQIYSCLCFQCRHVTYYALDPLNESGMADDGVEYFRTSDIDLSTLVRFSDNAKKHSNSIAISKIENLIKK